jgi:hypothetical protein
MVDRFRNIQHEPHSPPRNHAAVVPNDTDDVDPRPAALWIEAGGDLVISDESGGGNPITYTVQAGTVFPFRARVIKTATTATVVAWW